MKIDQKPTKDLKTTVKSSSLIKGIKTLSKAKDRVSMGTDSGTDGGGNGGGGDNNVAY